MARTHKRDDGQGVENIKSWQIILGFYFHFAAPQIVNIGNEPVKKVVIEKHNHHNHAHFNLWPIKKHNHIQDVLKKRSLK